NGGTLFATPAGPRSGCSAPRQVSSRKPLDGVCAVKPDAATGSSLVSATAAASPATAPETSTVTVCPAGTTTVWCPAGTKFFEGVSTRSETVASRSPGLAMSTTSSVACAKNPVTTADLAGGDVTGIQSLPRGVVPVLCRSTTAAATAPLLACTRR